MKTILRNFISVLRRFKMAMLLNVFGLSIAFAAFMVIMMQVNYDYTFDSCQPEADAIYRMDMDFQGKASAVFSRPFARGFTESSPHIKAGMIMASWNSELFYSVERQGERLNFQDPVVNASPGITRVFHFNMLEGDETALDQPETAIIPESMARRLFGDESAIGKRLMNVETGSTVATISGVFKDFPLNSSIRNIIYRQMHPKENYDTWSNQNYFFFFRMDDPANTKDVKENFMKNFDASQQFGKDFDWEKDGIDLRITPLPELHFLENVSFDSMPKASRQTVRVLFAIAFVILLIAGINFTNFSTALTPMRIKSINTQKVLGSSVSELRLALVSEAVCVSILACLLAFLLVYVLNELQWLSFVEADTLLRNHIGLMGILLVVSVGIGLVAGLYPAWYMTSFSPALVLKGNFGLSAGGRRMRTVLIGIQYIISIGLIIGAIFIQLQNRHMREFNLGFDKDQIAIVELNPEIAMLHKDAYSDKLKEYPGIEDVAFSSLLVGGQDSYMMQPMKYGDQDFYTYMLPVSWNFLRVMGMEVTEGRDFTEADAKNDSITTFIYNRSARERIRMEAGRTISGNMKGYIAGFTGDVRVVSFRLGGEEADVAFLVNNDPKPVSYIRLRAGTNAEEAVAHIRKALAEIDPAYPADIRFYDSVFDQLYHREQYIKNIISLFGLLAIVLSVVGVFGLVLFETQYRRKEIGIRKVYGASIGEILAMFNLVYLRVVVVCFVIAAPIAWYGVNKWLENFSSRIPIYWWAFALAFLVIALVTAITVTYQNWQAATENPVESIHIE